LGEGWVIPVVCIDFERKCVKFHFEQLRVSPLRKPQENAAVQQPTGKVGNEKKILVVLAFAGIDLVVLLFFVGLVVEDSRRWPILLAVGPALLFLITVA